MQIEINTLASHNTSFSVRELINGELGEALAGSSSKDIETVKKQFEKVRAANKGSGRQFAIVRFSVTAVYTLDHIEKV